MASFWDYVSSSALSLTVSGNTGISPFLTLLLLGVVENADPKVLNMDGTMEAILASWYSIAVLSILTLLEVIGKCIPAVDEIIDSVEVFVVPVISIFGTLGTLGVFDLVTNAFGGEENSGEMMIPMDQEGQRMLGDAGSTFLTVWKVILVLWGIGLALLIHFFKMIIRITGLVCCLGCCQPCITVLEITAVCCGVIFAIFIRPIAIAFCVIFLIAAAYTIYVKRSTKKGDEDVPDGNITTTSGNEQPKPSPASEQADENPGDAPQDVENPPPELEDNYEHYNNDLEIFPPPLAPSSALSEVMYTGMTPIPPPPASNPNYVADFETPVAIAVPIEEGDKQKSLPEEKTKRKSNARSNSNSSNEKDEKKNNSAIVY
ncbi:protein of unknown function DUF4126 containing protein [Nitzschia inconspicua]|uniref:DUF4126 domain-containing protein n=1 Tax=Nitzschia inconspicua TaxID=303405 RepID=A0A9K3KTW7_9STRA|nr:protein of unknown function DUF4126 containing protein [Nitzschia inconspicua]